MPERFHPRERIDELLARIAPERIDDVEVGVEPALEVTDAHAFERVIGNLLTNASSDTASLRSRCVHVGTRSWT